MAAPASQFQHPLPPPPEVQQQQQSPLRQQRQQQRQAQQPPYNQPAQPPRAKPRRFSFRSDKSRNNSFSNNKIDLHETHAEKDSRRIHSKADPTLAMNEAEPAAVAALTGTSLAPLRAIQHKDAYGNLIADPDKSNPTRNRWERPLDTIRSFEAAIEGDYARRSMHRSNTEPVSNLNRRGGYHPANQPRFPQESYHGSRTPSFRGEGSQYGMTAPVTARNSHYDNQGYNGGYHGGYSGHTSYGGYGPGPGRRSSRERSSRVPSEPHYQLHGREQNVYPLPHKDRSYETVTSAAVSGNSDPAGYQTDPTSSDNSSIDRTSPAKRVEPMNDYGITFSQSQPYKPPTLSVSLSMPGSHPLPAPPDASYQKPASTVPRKDISLLKRQSSEQRSDVSEKRKSWFARRFSKIS